MDTLTSTLKSFRKNRAVRRAEEKALRRKATIEAKAQVKAQKAAEKIRDKADSKNLKKVKKRAEKATKRTAKKAKKTASSLEQGHQERRRGAAELKIRENKSAEKAKLKQLSKEAKLQAKADKAAAKDAKVGRAHEKKMAELELAKIKQGHLNKDSAKRYVGFAQIVLPVLAPLAFKGITSAQGAGSPMSANPATALESRISALRESLSKLNANRGSEPEIARFSERTEVRLNDMNTALETAETIPTAERRNVHKSIAGELDRVNRDVLARLGVKS